MFAKLLERRGTPPAALPLEHETHLQTLRVEHAGRAATQAELADMRAVLSAVAPVLHVSL